MAQHEFKTRGIEGFSFSPTFLCSVDNLKVNLKQMMKQKEKSVNGLTAGVEMLMKKNKIDYLKGWGKITAPGQISIKGTEGAADSQITAKNIMIATGSEVSGFPGIEVIPRFLYCTDR